MKANFSALLAILLAVSPLSAAITIEDGHGTGYKMKVDKDGRADVLAVVEGEIEFESEKRGNAYAWSTTGYVSAAGDTILAVKSNSDMELYITDIFVSLTEDGEVTVHVPDQDVTMAGTAITGFNFNKKSGNAAESDARQDETGNTQGNIIYASVLKSSSPMNVELRSALILGRNDTIAVDVANAQTKANVTIWGYFKESLGN